MTDATANLALDPPAKPSGKKKLIPILAAVALAGGGFASTYLGLWSPAALLASKEEAPASPAVIFVAVPTIEAAAALPPLPAAPSCSRTSFSAVEALASTLVPSSDSTLA